MAEQTPSSNKVTRRKNTVDLANRLGFDVILLLIYLWMEYARPANPMKVPMAISIVLLLRWLFSPQKYWKSHVIYFLLFCGVIASMGPFAVNTFAIWNKFRGMAILLVCICIPLMHVVNTPRKINVLVYHIVAVYGYVAIYGLLHNGRGPGGLIGDENDLALALNMAIPYAFVSIFLVQKLINKLLCSGIFGLMIAGVVISNSRGGFLGLIPVLLYTFYLAPKKKLALGMALLVAVIGWFAIPEAYWAEMATIKDEAEQNTGTGGLRREFWAIAWEMYRANPIAGVGMGNFTWNIRYYEPADQGSRVGRSYAGNVAHSLYFSILAELGSAGMLLFLLVLWAAYKDTQAVLRAVKRYPQHQNALTPGGGSPPSLPAELDRAQYYAHAIRASILGYLVSGIFLTVVDYSHFWLFVSLAFALKETTLAYVQREASADPLQQAIPPTTRRRHPVPVRRQRVHFTR